MNTIKKSIVALVAIFAFSFSVNAQSNDQALIGKARAAASQCLTPYITDGIAIDATVETVGICFVEGFTKQVKFYTTVRCHQEPCPKPASVLVATVTFDCDGNVQDILCY